MNYELPPLAPDALEALPADDLVYHYWHAREQITHEAVSFLRKNRGLPHAELARRAYELRPEGSQDWTPPLAIRARKAARAGLRWLKRLGQQRAGAASR